MRGENIKMLKTKITLVLLTAVIAGGFIASKTSSQTRTETEKSANKSVVIAKAPIKCDVKAYVRGVEPEVANIRTAPGTRSKLLEAVKSADPIVFYITGTDDKGWFEISKAETWGGDTEAVLFEGRGWIHSSNIDLSVAAADPKLYSAPKKNSKVLKKLVADGSESLPVACRGDWMKVKSGNLTGWLSPDGQCANPLTTCS